MHVRKVFYSQRNVTGKQPSGWGFHGVHGIGGAWVNAKTSNVPGPQLRILRPRVRRGTR